MICKNCGAEIDENILLCPYCKTENEEVAYQEHREEIEGILNKAEEMKRRPERISKRINRGFSRLIFFAVAVFLALALLVFVVTRLVGDRSVSRMEKQLARLEEYYSAGEYEKMQQYLRKVDNSYSTTFKKYKSVANLYENLCWQKKQLGYLNEFLGLEVQKTEDFTSCLENCREILYEIWQAEKRGFVFGEADAMLWIRKEMQNALQEIIGITDEELAMYFSDFPENEEELPDLTELAETVKARQEAKKK